MDEFLPIAVVAALVLAYGLVSHRLATTPITGPIVFVGAGMVFGLEGFDLIEVDAGSGVLRTVAEGTLVLLLFTDAIRIDLKRLRIQAALPARLLGIGIPLTVALGTLVGAVLLTGLSVWEAALVAAILTPTDAALGQAVVTNSRVPARIRQAINVESGLNDGLMLPVVMVLLALTGAGLGLQSPQSWARFGFEQIGWGVATGVLVGYTGGWLLDRAAGLGWVDGVFRQLATLAIGVGAFAGAELVGGNGFVAAFVAGLGFGAAARDHCQGAYDFAEDEGHFLAMLTFLFFGAALAGPLLDALDWRIALYVTLSLTVVRMVPVALALIGTGLRAPTVAYIGWFGPRGIASILFVLLVLDQAALPGASRGLATVVWTVLASVVAHGATSWILSERYGMWFERHRGEAESRSVEMMPTRTPVRRPGVR